MIEDPNDMYKPIQVTDSETALVAKAYDETGKQVPITEDHYETPLPAEKTAIPPVDLFGYRLKTDATQDINIEIVKAITQNVSISSDGTTSGTTIKTADGVVLNYCTRAIIDIDPNTDLVTATLTFIQPRLNMVIQHVDINRE